MAVPDAFAPPSSSVNDLDPDGSPVEPELPEPEIQTGRQKARAAVMEVDPPEMLAKIVQWFEKRKRKNHGEYSLNTLLPPPPPLLSVVQRERKRERE